MSYRNSFTYSGYPATSPSSRESPLQSPSTNDIQAIKTRLNFSAAKLPTPKRSLINHQNFVGMSAGSASSLNSFYQNRIGEYHMSRQNPNILDEMYTSPLATRDGEGGRWNGNAAGSGKTRKTSHMLTLNEYSISPQLGGAGRISQNSFLRRALERRSQSSSPCSLVQLATRKSAGRLLRNGIGRSPVTVRLAGVKKEGTNQMEMKGEVGGQVDPCDKEVVLSALRQKRKRWASSVPEENGYSPALGVTSPPMSKRVRKEVRAESPPIAATVDRKRSHITNTTVFPAVKRSKANDLCGPTNILSLSEMDCEEEELTEEERGRASKSVHYGVRTEEMPVAPTVVANGICGGRGFRGMTPPILINDDIDKKRDESLGTLKAVFTSPHEAEKKDSLRRKLPIFCATGTKPHLPSPLSATHSVTREDLKKDREAIAARLKAFLEADDETDGMIAPYKVTPSDPKLTDGLQPAATDVGVVFDTKSAAKLTSVSTGMPPSSTPTPLTASLPVSVGAVATTCIAKSSSTKTVSFAPLPNLAVPSSNQLPTFTSASSAQGSSLITGTKPVSQSQGTLQFAGDRSHLATSAPQPPATLGSSSVSALATSGLSSIPIPQQSATLGLSSIPIPQQSATSGLSSIPIPQQSATLGLSAIPAPQQSATLGLLSIPAPQQSATIGLSSIPAPQQLASSGLSSIPAPQQSATLGLSAQQSASSGLLVPAQQTATSGLLVPAYQPTATSGLLVPAYQQTAPVQQPASLQGQAGIPTAHPRTVTATELGGQQTTVPNTTPANSLFKNVQPATTQSLASVFNQGQGSQLSSLLSQPLSQTSPPSALPSAIQQTLQLSSIFKPNVQTHVTQAPTQTPKLPLFGKASISSAQTSLNMQPSSQSSLFKQSTPQLSLFNKNPQSNQSAPSGGNNSSLGTTTQPVNFTFSAQGKTASGLGVAPGSTLFGGPASAGNSQGVTPGSTIFGGLNPAAATGNSQGSSTLFGGQNTTAATSNNTQGQTPSSTLFGGLNTAAATGNTQGGSTLFGGLNNSVAAANTQGSSALFGGLNSSAATGQGGTPGSTLFGGLNTAAAGSNTQGGTRVPTGLFGGLNTSAATGQGGTPGSTLFGGPKTAPIGNMPAMFGGQTAGFQFGGVSNNQQGTGSGLLGTASLSSAPQTNTLNQMTHNQPVQQNIFNPDQLKGSNSLLSGLTNPLTKTAGGGGVFGGQQPSFQFGGDTKLQPNGPFEFGGGSQQPQQQTNNIFAGSQSMFQAGSTPRKTVSSRGRRRKK